MAELELACGQRWHYVERGDGPSTVILLHCSAGSSSQWSALAELLEAEHRVIAPDLYGYGRSADWPGPGALTLADEAAPIARLLRHHPQPVHLVAHSYGGAVGLELALEREIPLASMTLIEPVAFHLLRRGGASGRRELRGIEAVARTIGDAAARGDPASAMACFIDYWNGAGSWDRMHPDVRRALAAKAGKLPHDFAACTRESYPLGECRTLDSPALLVRGEHAPAPTRRILDMLAGVLAGARSAVIAGAGHLAPITHAAEVNACIVAHVAANEPAMLRRAV